MKDAGYEMAVADGEPIFTDLDGVILTGRELENAKKVWEDSGHASGLTFTGTGIYAGKFHGPEEVLSQATTIKGPGIIDRALGALDGAVGSAGRATAGFSQAAPVTINPVIQNDFNGAKFSSDIDIEDMLKKMEKRLIPACTTAIARQIGQGRT